MAHILILGGGAAGLVAALAAAQTDPTARVTVLERSPRPGKKLLATGNGRCNLDNEGITPESYSSADRAALDALLRTVIRLHNAYRLPEEMDDRTRMFCQILRDADKIDILRVNVETPMEQIYNVSTEALRQSPVSPAVLDAFYEHHCVLRTLNHYPADNAVGHASFVFELCYPESLRAVAEQGWLWKLLDFKTENPDTAKAFAGMKAEMQRWLEAHAK